MLVQVAMSLLVHAGKGKALVFAGVPAMQSKALHAGQWLNAALAVLGGKGGGKPVAAQGSGPKARPTPHPSLAPTIHCMLARLHILNAHTSATV